MKIAVLKETRKNELRVAATPDAVKKYVALGFKVVVEKGAGLTCNISDSDYKAAGAEISARDGDLIKGSDIFLKVQRDGPGAQSGQGELDVIRKGAILIGTLHPFENEQVVKSLSAVGISSFSMDLLPRITRAQSMDVLSSQNNLAGYRAVIDAAFVSGKAMPMMMTAAGTVAPAKVCVIGAGVSGLQAIATAKRLGAVVSAFDVRRAAGEQVRSLGASFIEVPVEEEGEGSGGYAKEMSPEYLKKQSELLAENLKKMDMVISTALIPGKKAPTLITAEMVAGMKPGSVIIDMAAVNGGNCELTRPDEESEHNGVIIVGPTNYPSRLPRESSELYARNLYNFIAAFYNKEAGTLSFPVDDDIVKGAMLTRDGEIVHPSFKHG